MYEKVNPSHPDKIADRIAGAIIDQAYARTNNPHIAVEVLIGHDNCHIIAESNVSISKQFAEDTVHRITGSNIITTHLHLVPQDTHLAQNQVGAPRCGDNGIFCGIPTNVEEERLTDIANLCYDLRKHDGKYILDDTELIICHSQIGEVTAINWRKNIANKYRFLQDIIINPLGPWGGGTGVDTGATNRKLGSDMGRAVTGGGLHGKDLSKADVSVNIICHLMAQQYGVPVRACCAIGDEMVRFRVGDAERAVVTPFANVVEDAKTYIDEIGGFEKFAEWGLIRPKD